MNFIHFVQVSIMNATLNCVAKLCVRCNNNVSPMIIYKYDKIRKYTRIHTIELSNVYTIYPDVLS